LLRIKIIGQETGGDQNFKYLWVDLESSRGRNLVYGCDSDFVAELAKCSREHLGTLPFLLGIGFAAFLDESHPFMQDLPNQTTELMGNGPDAGLIA
jgi:hypothetical protein